MGRACSRTCSIRFLVALDKEEVRPVKICSGHLGCGLSQCVFSMSREYKSTNVKMYSIVVVKGVGLLSVILEKQVVLVMFIVA